MAYKHWAALGSGIELLGAQRRGVGMDSWTIYLSMLRELFPFHSVCDMGCASGYWLNGAVRMGIDDIWGYDVTPMPDSERLFDPKKFTLIDLGVPLEAADRRFDLVVSTEVGEHLPRSMAPTFVANLTRFGDVILFGAALPYQGGVGHQNENWVEYWNQLFRANGFECYDIFRPVLWNRPDVHYYYRQNTMLFVKQGSDQFLKDKGFTPTANPLSLVHPELLIQAVNRALPAVQRQLERDAAHYYDVVGATSAASLPDQVHDYGQENFWSRSWLGLRTAVGRRLQRRLARS